MKINEIQKIEEAPVSAIKQKAQAVGSRVLNKVGAKNKAANLAGKADFGATANKLYTQFNSYLGTQDKTIKQATGVDLDTFLKSKNVKGVSVPDGVLQKSQIDAIIKDVAKKAMQGAPQKSAGGQAVDANGDGKDDKTGKPMPAAKGGEKPRVPAKLLTALQKLTPEEKKTLASLL